MTHSSPAARRPQIGVDQREMQMPDLPAVLEIEALSFAECWTRTDFEYMLAQPQTYGMVATDCGKIVGFTVFEIQKPKVLIRNFAIHPDFRRQSVGTQILNMFKYLAIKRHCTTLEVILCETSVNAQIFLRANQFRCTQILPGHYESDRLDGYKFQYELTQ